WCAYFYIFLQNNDIVFSLLPSVIASKRQEGYEQYHPQAGSRHYIDIRRKRGGMPGRKLTSVTVSV
ncbi:TPA: hypothetical protein ACIWM6_004515, partial [Salmonella enterica subsp. enterica serovar Saintpaul]|uniref:hypothetical protein n=3 Tax=Salmonella enterica TaxID=28901 RepID=UPI0019D52C32